MSDKYEKLKDRAAEPMLGHCTPAQTCMHDQMYGPLPRDFFVKGQAVDKPTEAFFKPSSIPAEHQSYYGGADNPYEAIKVIEAWELGFHLGNVLKYLARAGKKTPDVLEDLRKARWYLEREIKRRNTDGN